MKRIVALILCLTLSLSCSGALALSELINPNVSQFCFYYMQYAMALSESVDDFSILEKLAFSAGKIGYFDHDARTGYTGQKVADGGASNQLGTCTLGVGAGLSNENLWYVTNTYYPGLDYLTLRVSAISMILASDGLGVSLGEDDTAVATAMELADMLLASTESTAYQLDDVVYFCKLLDGRTPLEGGMFILGVNSLEFYNEFYYGSIKNYNVIE